eukprot:5339653-Alexandrium_andersonii.AAC.1
MTRTATRWCGCWARSYRRIYKQKPLEKFLLLDCLESAAQFPPQATCSRRSQRQRQRCATRTMTLRS